MAHPDPDPGGKMNADPCGSGSTALNFFLDYWVFQKIRVAEPPDFWAAPAPAPDQNFGGSGPGHFSSAVVLLIMSRL